MRLLETQTNLAGVLCSDCNVEVFERYISTQGRPNNLDLGAGLDLCEDSVEATELPERLAMARIVLE